MVPSEAVSLGATPARDGTTFRVWAPAAEELAVVVEGREAVAMRRGAGGVHEARVPGVAAGERYRFRFPDGRLRADPASRLQEGSVHEASTVVDLAHPWTDAGWRGVPLERLVTYELHPGTFTRAGTLEAILPRLPVLRELGVTAIELMPLAAFDGDRGWGYDGVLLYAVHQAYGGPRALQRLVDACHREGLAVILDVVYNHLGPSGNYLRDFGPFFTSRHSTPWGEAVNYDGQGSEGVRRFVVENALQWVRDFHVDGLRLDAIHGIVDESPKHIVQEIGEAVAAHAAAVGRPVHVIAESDLNDPRVVERRERGGFGLDAQWSDDFHHALHTLLTGERGGYYGDYGRVEDLATAYRESFVYSGQASRHRGRPHGKPARGLPGRRFVVCAQNHDQVGNRALGDRLAAALAPEGLRLAAAATLLSPFLPLLFMGEEYGETAPFQYFTSFPDQELGRLVSEGRRREFQAFAWKGEVPDPQAPETFERSKLRFDELRTKEPHASLWRFHQRLLELRRTLTALSDDRLAPALEATPSGANLLVRRGEALLAMRFAPEVGPVQLPAGRWRVAVDSWDPRFAGASGHALGDRVREASLELGPWHAALLIRE